MKMGDVHANDPSREDHDAKGQRPGAGNGTLEQRASAEARLLWGRQATDHELVAAGNAACHAG